MSATRYSLTGGMNNVLPAEHLPDGTAALIQNMRLRDDGGWEAVKIPEYQDSIQFETPHVWKWEPVHMPRTAGANETSVWVYFGDGACMVLWKDTNGEPDLESLKPIGTYDLDHLRVSYDAQQFVFVDGREGHGAQRITINPEGEIACRSFGTQQPITAPTINQIDNSKYEDNKYTGMPVGSILYYAYCIVNEYGERSNPSPVTVCDTAQWLAKGELLVDDYQYTDVNGGSIKSVSVTCPIPVPSEAKRVELYRTHAEYFESSRPVDPMRLVRSVDLQDEANSVTITDASFTSPVEIDYENDCAPAGDDIVLESGTLFVANAVSNRTFAYPVSRVWMIRLDNQNTINYVNRWFTIDIRDEGDCGNLACFEGLTDAGAICEPGTRNKWRFVDTDMITPLKAYMCPGPGILKKVTNAMAAYSNLTHIQIPYVMASAEKIIYLVEFDEHHGDYGNPCNKLATADDYQAFHDSRIDNPVRDENCIVAHGVINNTTKVSDGWQKALGNKANAIMDTPSTTSNPAVPTSSTAAIYIDSEELGMGIANTNTPIYKQSANNVWEYSKADGMPGTHRGFIYGRAVIEPVDGEYNPLLNNYLFALVPVTGTGEANGWAKGVLWLLGDANTGVNQIRFWINIYGTNDSYNWGVDLSNISIPLGERANLYVFYSWETRLAQESDYWDQTCDATIALLLHYPDGTRKAVKRTMTHPIWGTHDPSYISIRNYESVPTGMWYVNLGEYISDEDEIYSLSRFNTHFESPASVIGWRSETSSRRVVNKNVTWEAYELRNEKRPGKIRWSLGGAVPELYERNIFQEIKRIIPLKSWQPTDEHNTLLIWTKDKVLRMALSGDNREASALITEMHGVGLQNPDELAQVTEGVIWKDGSGIYLLNANSLKEIGRQVVDIADETMTALYDKKNKEVLFIPADGNAYCYNLKWGAWSRLDYGLDAKQFIEYDGKWCLVADGVYDLDPTDDTKLAPLIRTKKHPARLKLRRLTIHPSAGKVKALIHNHRLAAGYTASPTYTLSGDDPKAMPQLSGDYVQFEIVTDTIHTYDIEAAD